MKTNSFYSGWWNGEPAMYAVLNCIVAKIENPLPHQIWQEPFIGQTRQIIMVRYNDRDFAIDNYDGMGLYKVLDGKGLPEFRHRAIEFDIVINEAQQNKWQKLNNVLVSWQDKCIVTYFESGAGETFKQLLLQLEEFKQRDLF